MAQERKSLIEQFKDFVLRGNVVDLAVAIAVGTAFLAVIKAFTADMLTPVVSVFSKHTNFQDLAVTVRGARFAYGDFINNVIAFVITAAVVFFLVVTPMNYFIARRKARAGEQDAPSEEVALLTEIRDLLRATRGPSSGTL